MDEANIGTIVLYEQEDGSFCLVKILRINILKNLYGVAKISKRDGFMSIDTKSTFYVSKDKLNPLSDIFKKG